MFIIVKTIDYTYDSPTNEVAVFDTFKEVTSFLEEEQRNLKNACDIEFHCNDMFELASLFYNDYKNHASIYYYSFKITSSYKNKMQGRF